MQPELRHALMKFFELSEEDVNGFEPDDELHAVLQEMVHETTTQTYQRLLQASAAESQAAETAAEADRLERIVEALGVSFNELSANTRSALALVSTAAAALQIQHPTSSVLIVTAIHASIQASDRRLQKLQEAAASARAGAQRAAEGARAAEEALRQAQAELREREALLPREREQAAEFISKARQYEASVAVYERSLQAVRADPQLLHERLEALGLEVEAMHAEAQKVEARLVAYRGLPPSVLGAQLEVRNLRDQLGSMRQQLEQSLVHL